MRRYSVVAFAPEPTPYARGGGAERGGAERAPLSESSSNAGAATAGPWAHPLQPPVPLDGKRLPQLPPLPVALQKAREPRVSAAALGVPPCREAAVYLRPSVRAHAAPPPPPRGAMPPRCAAVTQVAQAPGVAAAAATAPLESAAPAQPQPVAAPATLHAPLHAPAPAPEAPKMHAQACVPAAVPPVVRPQVEAPHSAPAQELRSRLAALAARAAASRAAAEERATAAAAAARQAASARAAAAAHLADAAAAEAEAAALLADDDVVDELNAAFAFPILTIPGGHRQGWQHASPPPPPPPPPNREAAAPAIAAGMAADSPMAVAATAACEVASYENDLDHQQQAFPLPRTTPASAARSGSCAMELATPPPPPPVHAALCPYVDTLLSAARPQAALAARSRVLALHAAPGGAVAVATADGALRLWSPSAQRRVTALVRAPSRGLAAAALLPPGAGGMALGMAAACADGSLRRYDLLGSAAAAGSLEPLLQAGGAPLRCVAAAAEAPLLAAAGDGADVALFDLRCAPRVAVVARFTVPGAMRLASVALDGAGATLATASSAAGVCLFEARSPSGAAAWLPAPGACHVALDAPGRACVALGGGALRSWRLLDRALSAAAPADGPTFALSPDGAHALLPRAAGVRVLRIAGEPEANSKATINTALAGMRAVLDWEDPGPRRAATAAVAWGDGDGDALLFSGDDGGGVVAWGCNGTARELHLSTEAALLR